MQNREETQKDKAPEAPEKPSLFLAINNYLLRELFNFACTLVNVFVIQTIWNWHIADTLNLPPVSFTTVFVLLVLLKRAVLGRTGDTIQQIKRVNYLSVGIIWDTSVKENLAFLRYNGALYFIAWLLKRYGDLL
jgi:hypothetical protein